MRLINSKIVLAVEDSFNRRVQPDPSAEILVELFGPQLSETRYAILSHCWGVSDAGEREVLFKEMKKLTMINEAKRNEIRDRTGYKKILDTCTQAKEDGLDWVWIDTCCINKESSSELSEAINSMYQWYANSAKCYAYLHDVDDSFPVDCNFSKYHHDANRDRTKYRALNGWPKWFSRGWTLQELVAPVSLRFFNKKWEDIGNKQQLASKLNHITRIPTNILKDGLSSTSRPSVAQIMSWAADRITTREEDRAYSLLGLLGVHMPMLYGEGKNAFRRLQLEIIRRSNDQSIFAWGWRRTSGWTSSFLADDPSHFRDCDSVVKMDRGDFIQALQGDVLEDKLLHPPLEQLRMFTVTNDGIQIWLPVKPFPSFPQLFLAKLACCSSKGLDPITIVLVRFELSYYRYFGNFKPPSHVKMQFKQLLLSYEDEIYPASFQLHLDSRLLMDRWTTGPQLNSLDLSNTRDYASVVFEPTIGSEDTSFTIAFSYRHGQLSVHVIRDHKYAQVATLDTPFDGIKFWHSNATCLVKHVHFPQLTKGVRITCSQNHRSKTTCAVTIDAIKCSGCCTSTWHRYDLVKDLGMPGLMKNAIPWTTSVYELFVDSVYCTQFLRNDTKSTFSLGDYGYIRDDGNFQREGNILSKISVNPDPAKRIVHESAGENMQKNWVKAVGFDWSNRHSGVLALQHALCLSLPNTSEIISLLKDPSIGLSVNCLVTAVVQCEQCYYTDEEEITSWPGDAVFTPQPHDPWKKLDITAPLYTLMTPLAWFSQAADWETRKQFNAIRYHFYILSGWGDSADDPNKRVEAIKFFVDIFGGGHFTDLIGNITFFDRLPSIMGTNQHNSDVTIEELTNVGEESRVEILAQKLIKRIQFVDKEESWESLLFTRGTEFRRDAEELRSRGFGAGLLLQVIGAVYTTSSNILVSNKDDLKAGIDVESIRITVQKVKGLSEKYPKVNDDDGRRALEEDITGMILLTCWRGVRSEVEQVLTKVVDRVVNDMAVDGGLGYARALCLRDIAVIFKEVLDECPDNGQCPLRRVLQDAEKGVLKHDLLFPSQTDVPVA